MMQKKVLIIIIFFFSFSEEENVRFDRTILRNQQKEKLITREKKKHER